MKVIEDKRVKMDIVRRKSETGCYNLEISKRREENDLVVNIFSNYDLTTHRAIVIYNYQWSRRWP